MTPEQYVKQFYPDAYCEDDGVDFWICTNSSSGIFIIGEGNSVAEAWKDARKCVIELPESEKPSNL